MFKVKMPFYEMAGEIGSDSFEQPSVAEEGQEPSDDGNAPASVQEGSEQPPSASDDVVKQESFAKRLKEEREKILTEERAKWEQEAAEKYKDYDVAKKTLEFMMKSNNISDPLTLKEQIELAELQDRADQANVPPEVLKRIDELEAKAAKAEEYEALQAEQATRTQFETELKTFCEGKEIGGKPVDHAELWQYMYDNQIAKPEIAYKAMKADQLEQELANAEKGAVEKYLASKKAPRAEGSGSTAFEQPNTAKMSWEEIDRVAAARIRAANQPQ